MDFTEIVSKQRSFFHTLATQPYEYRIHALKRLRAWMEQNERAIFDALHVDLGKSDFEAYMTEVGIVYEELTFALKHLKKWMKPCKKPTPFAHFPANSTIYPNPYGVVMIMSPWNYPMQLTLAPLIGALAAGNCVVLKPASYAPATSQLISDMAAACFPPEYVEVVQGGREQNSGLLEQHFDYIFFTGSVNVGKLVMESASKFLTPVTLELGGKSPCIVDETIDVKLAAKRIVFGKFTNAGQTCVAPDHLYVHNSKKDELVREMISVIKEFFTADQLNNPDYPRIITQKHFERISGLMEGANILYGGKRDAKKCKIQPTLIDGVDRNSPSMGEEIFGPVFPIMAFDNIDAVLHEINARPHPLAFYLFTEDKELQRRVTHYIPYGGGCINDTLVHIATSHMPFGGMGDSGMGGYHGKNSFDTFTHYKSVLKKSTKLDLEIRYLPATEKKLKALRKFLK